MNYSVALQEASVDRGSLNHTIRRRMNLDKTRWLTLVGMTGVGNQFSFSFLDIHGCQINKGVSPGFQGWYIQPLSIWANLTSNSDLTKRYEVLFLTIDMLLTSKTVYEWWYQLLLTRRYGRNRTVSC